MALSTSKTLVFSSSMKIPANIITTITAFSTNRVLFILMPILLVIALILLLLMKTIKIYGLFIGAFLSNTNKISIIGSINAIFDGIDENKEAKISLFW